MAGGTIKKTMFASTALDNAHKLTLQADDTEGNSKGYYNVPNFGRLIIYAKVSPSATDPPVLYLVQGTYNGAPVGFSLGDLTGRLAVINIIVGAGKYYLQNTSNYSTSALYAYFHPIV